MGAVMKTRFWSMLAVVIFLHAPPLAAQAGKQAAIVEDLSGRIAGLEVFDFVSLGHVIVLPAGAKLVLGYLGSCSRETITGAGKVTVGETGSTVSGAAKLQQEQLKCASAMHLGAGQTGKSGAMVFRGQPGSGRKKADIPDPAVVISYTAPVFAIDSPGRLTVERLDIQETVLVFEAKGKLLDTGKAGAKLDAGGYYRAELNGRTTVFHVSMQAGEGSGPLLMRLVRFQTP